MNDEKYKKIALILCLDENKENKYEYECLFSLITWRLRKHKLSNIDIYVYINKNRKIRSSTISFIKRFSNIYLKYYEYNFKLNVDFPVLYPNFDPLYCQYLFENYETQYNYSIFMDLDLYLKYDIPNDYLFQNKTIFMLYNKEENDFKCDVYDRIINNNRDNIHSFNMCFVINNCNLKLFSKIIKYIGSESYNIFYNKNKIIHYMEGIFDYAYSIGVINTNNSIFVEDKYIEGTPYTPNSENAIAIHQHIKSINDLIYLCKKNEKII